MTQYRIDRDVYSVLGWIGDVGGLNEGLVIMISITLSILNFSKFDHFLVEYLYRKPAPSLFDSTDNGSGGSPRSSDDTTKKKRKNKAFKNVAVLSNKKTIIARQKCHAFLP